ncbi:SDR family NAD(P)-dependent oxidoreductase [Paenibacillus whitsoniae]|uniref:SDR family oxidoreductase n=1 Tax=Paenibacillus whitsoniae TaxID=2496558 RepID=A0A430JA77_9BACL|nr:SDR family NAD(P)-dependent oxidoreductase [Paenibacillus whitsoniae]RTE07930.1 SDR family oxidoreductase [Paenibacillus whitsoniae]
MLLEGKVALITGASKGIGRATALVLAKHGAAVVINGRNENDLQSLAAQISEISEHVPLVLCYDVTDAGEVKRAFQRIHKQYGKLDVLVNNAGILNDGMLGLVQQEKLNEMFDVNVMATISHMQYATRLMMRKKSGSIINVSSILGRYGDVGQVGYAASKAAVIGATTSAAKEFAPSNIRVNAVAPGFIETDMTSKLSKERYNDRLSNIHMGRAGKPEEVANTILFLASDLSTYVTGQVLGVDGGMVV